LVYTLLGTDHSEFLVSLFLDFDQPQEALRKYSVVPLVTRHVIEDIHVKKKDYHDSIHNTQSSHSDSDSTSSIVIPKGSTILVNIQAVHHNPEYWPNPMSYDPYRFLRPEHPTVPFTFLPFIAGPRNCLGQHLSLLESKMVLGMLTQRYNFSLPPGEILETKSWQDARYDPRHRYMVPVCPKEPLRVLVSKKE
jgi:Cytochrome P450